MQGLVDFYIARSHLIDIHEFSDRPALKIEQLKANPARVNPVWTMEK